MGAERPRDRLRFEIAVRGSSGPRGGTVRHVLLDIASFCRRRGSIECWPSLAALEESTDLARHTILSAIAAAVEQGWLQVRDGRIDGMRGRRNIYTLTVPSGAVAAPDAAPFHGAEVAPHAHASDGAETAPKRDDEAVQKTAVVGAKNSFYRCNAVLQVHEDTNEVAMNQEGNHEVNQEEGKTDRDFEPNHEQENDMYDTSRNPEENRRHGEREVQSWHRREAERLGIPREPGESVAAFEGRVARAYAQSPKPSA